MTRLAFLLLPLLALTACASLARVVYPVNDDAFNAKPGDYQLDPSHAAVVFAVDHLGFSTYYGRFNTLEGRLSFSPKAPENSSVAITIKTASVDTNSEELDDKLRAATMFDSEVFPDARFVSTGVTVTGDNLGQLDGLLTIKDITQPVSLSVAFGGSGTNPLTGKQTVGFNAEGQIKRSDFGLTAWLPLVGDDIHLLINAEFIRP